jgi:hypothetical protein
MNRCRSCKRKIALGALHESGSTFCSAECRDHFFHPGFCQACLATSDEVSAGNMWNAFGSGERAYRVKYVSPGRFLSRRLPAATAWQIKLERWLGPNARLGSGFCLTMRSSGLRQVALELLIGGLARPLNAIVRRQVVFEVPTTTGDKLCARFSQLDWFSRLRASPSRPLTPRNPCQRQPSVFGLLRKTLFKQPHRITA